MYIDSHAHLTDKKFARDLERAVERACDAGVERIICIGDTLESSRKAVALAHRIDRLFATAGIHPHHVRRAQDSDYQGLAELAGEPRIVAIGEVGLDYHYNLTDPEEQKQGFERQVGMARELDLPMVVHCREAFEDLFDILERNQAGDIGGVVHCFSGTPDEAKRLVDMGWHIGIGGPVTFPHANQLRDAVAATPVERILLETDSPYLPPQNKRGRRNEPSYLRYVIKPVADLKELTFQQLARFTRMNTIRLFNLPDEEQSEITYSLKKSLYLNITNQCPNDCYFCYRNRDYNFAGYNLQLDEDPDTEEVIDSIEELDKYDEVVFCGIGEPTRRLDVMLPVARALKKKGARLRLNTNGQGNLIHGRNIVGDLAEVFEAVSISLNAATAEDYNQICRPEEPDKAFDAVIEFARLCKKLIPEVTFTTVAAPEVDMEACRILSEDKLKIPLRIREYVPAPPSEIRPARM